MLEYNLDDAEALLERNLNAAKKSVETVEEDLGFLRDQTTTIEVNMARIYNWDVKRRQSQQPSISKSWWRHYVSNCRFKRYRYLVTYIPSYFTLYSALL